MAETLPKSSDFSDDESSQASLDSLRARLVRARADRGTCPPLEELQLDGMPSNESRPGREERAQHLERCDVCQANMASWRESWEGRAAQLLSWAKVGSKRLGDATERVARNAATARPRLPRRRSEDHPPTIVPEPSATPTYSMEATEPVAYAPPMAPVAPPTPKVTPLPAEPVPIAPASPASPPAPIPFPVTPKRTRRARAQEAPATLPPLIVLEAPLAGVIPSALLRAAHERGAAVVAVENAEEALRDPDFGAVQAIILTRSRPLADWEHALTSVRERAPGRIVLAIVAAPRLGPAAVTWRRDPGILNPPVGDNDWAAALVRMGWLPAK